MFVVFTTPGTNSACIECGDDLQGAAASMGQCSMSIPKTRFAQARPTHARARRVRVGLIGAGMAGGRRRAGNDGSTRLRVRGEHAVEADQMPARAGNDGGQRLA